jgi:plasmid replication initiation protein
MGGLNAFKNLSGVLLNTRVLKSRYSIKLYLFLKSWKRKQFIDISVKELRDMVEIEQHEYKEYTNFRRRVIEPAKAELTQKCDLTFDYEEIRANPNNKKSEVIKIRFYIIENKSNWTEYKKHREEKNQTIEIKEKPQRLNKLIEKKVNEIQTIPVELIQEVIQEQTKPAVNPEVLIRIKSNSNGMSILRVLYQKQVLISTLEAA